MYHAQSDSRGAGTSEIQTADRREAKLMAEVIGEALEQADLVLGTLLLIALAFASLQVNGWRPTLKTWAWILGPIVLLTAAALLLIWATSWADGRGGGTSSSIGRAPESQYSRSAAPADRFTEWREEMDHGFGETDAVPS